MPTDATTGTWAFDNPSSGTQHFVFGNPIASVAVNTLLLYDRLFSVTKTMNSSTTEAVTECLRATKAPLQALRTQPRTTS